MPITTQDAPEALPKAAKDIYVGAFNGAFDDTCQDRSDRDACAAKIAWSAVKEKYHKVGDEWVAQAALASIELVITKATLQADGSMRWQAVASDIGVDQTGECTSIQLFNDWIERAESGKTERWLPPPGQPFLGLSHYPALGGQGKAGLTERMFVDGDRFKADGPFLDTPLGKALFEAVRGERELIKRGETVEQPIRISAAWWDVQHVHGEFVFTRRSMSDICPMCIQSAGDKIYLQGQLDHYAATRVPINPRTALELEEKSMVKKIARRDDAASIVGDELANDLEERVQELTGKSATEEPGLVVKADETPADTETPDVEKDAIGAAMEYDYWPFGGATSIGEAEEYIESRQMLDRFYTTWDIFDSVLSNIMSKPEGEIDKIEALRQAVAEFGDKVAAVKAKTVDAFLVQPVKGDTAMNDKITQPANSPALLLQAAVDAALANPSVGREAVTQAVQTAIETYVVAVKAQIDSVAPPAPGEQVADAIKSALQPVVEQMGLVIAKLNQQSIVPAQVPQQKSVTGPVQTNAPAIHQGPPNLRDIVRRSVGLRS